VFASFFDDVMTKGGVANFESPHNETDDKKVIGEQGTTGYAMALRSCRLINVL
jgi:hypothetical protein